MSAAERQRKRYAKKRNQPKTPSAEKYLIFLKYLNDLRLNPDKSKLRPPELEEMIFEVIDMYHQRRKDLTRR
jgi:hypothetical protein